MATNVFDDLYVAMSKAVTFVVESSFTADLREVDFRHVPRRNCEKSVTKDGSGNSTLWRHCASKTCYSISTKVCKQL